MKGNITRDIGGGSGGTGKRTNGSGEIFNDYKTNKAISPFSNAHGTDNLAGSRAFTIIALDNAAKTYTLDSVEGLAVGDVYSVHLYNQWENAGKITAIDKETNTVTVDKHFGTELNTTSVAIEDDGFDNEKNTFRIIAKPHIGTRSIGCAASALGYNNKVLSKGGLSSGVQNNSHGSYSVTHGAENEAGYCGFAQGAYNKLKGFWSAVFGKTNVVTGECSFGAGEGLEVSGNRQSVFGSYNTPVSNALQIIGNGTSESERGNAYTLDLSGNATFAGEVTARGVNLNTTAEMLHADIEKEKYDRILEDSLLANRIDAKAPTSHSSTSTTYGVGTSTNYGHLKWADNLTTTASYTALSAKQGKVLDNKITNLPIKKLVGTYEVSSDGTSKTSTSGTIICDTRERTWGDSSADTTGNVATGDYSLAAGRGNTSTGRASLSTGYMNEAYGDNGVTFGMQNRAGGNAIVGGRHNVAKTTQFKFGYCADDGSFSNGVNDIRGDAIIIGNGTVEYVIDETTGYYNYNSGYTISPSNAFRVTYKGDVYGLSAYNSTGADYAEFFEWTDGNPDNEDRRGKFVTLDGEKIRLATSEDEYILGIISANPCIRGDNYSDDWQGKYLTDVFGNKLTQMTHYNAEYEERETTDPETGEKTVERIKIADEYDAEQWIINPEYDREKEYISREDRPEWSAVGFMGKLVAVDDGTCVAGGYAAVSEDGTATHSDIPNNCRVMKRLDDTHIYVVLK